MAIKPIRSVTKNITPAGSNLVLLDDGVSMGKATLTDAVTVVASPLADAKIAALDLDTASKKPVEFFATAAQGTNADTAVQPARTVAAGTGLTGGGDLSADRTIGLDSASQASLALADTATQPGDLATVATSGGYNDLLSKPTLGDLASKDKVAIADIDATGAAGSSTFLRGDGQWVVPVGAGDMLASVYDPQAIEADAFDRANHTGTATIDDDELLVVDPSDATKKMRFDAGNVTAGQTRVLTMPDADLDLTGLATQAEGDILYRGASAWQRLPKGTAGQVLRQNAGLTAPEWKSGRETIDIVGSSGSVAALGYSSTLSSFRTVKLVSDLVPVNSGFNIVLELTTDGGSTWVSTGGLYRRAATYGDGSSMVSFTADTDTMLFNVVDGVSNLHNFAFGIEIRDFNNSNSKSFEYFARFVNNGSTKEYFVNGGGRMAIGAATGLRVRVSSGNATFRNVELTGTRG